jgi:heme exporter protein CcmB
MIINNIKHSIGLGWKKQGILYQSLSIFTLVVVFGVYLSISQQGTAHLWLAMSWLGISFAALHGQEWWFEEELQQGTLDIMQTKPMMLGSWVIAKFLAFLLLIMLPIVALAWLLAWGAGYDALKPLAIGYALAAITFSGFACLGASLTCAIAQRGSISYCLLLPMMLPVMLLGLLSADRAQTGNALLGMGAYAALMLPLCLGLSTVLIHHAAKE